MASPTTDISDGTRVRGIYSIPIELRFQIYKFTWEPQTVFISARDPTPDRNPPKPPLTLHINKEARNETLNYYHEFTFVFEKNREKILISKRGYINPRLDILHLGPCWDLYDTGQNMLKFQPAITKPLLRVTLDRGMNANHGLIFLDLRCKLIAGIRTIDFWINVTRPCSLVPEGYNDDNGNPVRIDHRTTSRYRICRNDTSSKASASKLPIATWKNAVFRLRRYGAQHSGWAYSPEESSPLQSMPANLLNLIDWNLVTSVPLLDDPDSHLRTVCAVSNWHQLKPRNILKKTGVLMFDADPTGSQSSNQERPTWSILKVVCPDTVWYKHINSLAFGHLINLSPLTNEQVAKRNIARAFRILHEPSILSISHTFFGATSPFIEALQEMRGSHFRPFMSLAERPAEEVVHGVCGPEYLYDYEEENHGEDWKHGAPRSFFARERGNFPFVSGARMSELHLRYDLDEELDVDDEILCADPRHQRVIELRYEDPE
ncbi:hypothetical protein B0T21DRAFT_351269 [Apiosordaria backusii]|uniref:2EXR domain-containing protein n=1 Tax=Apiosordaria backusii TaxID=314023 RepID=A0AA40ASR3_9PEZI|nr:hypothetical protein B0T21DRAFT_351269 [Apiosordaria backusii]